MTVANMRFIFYLKLLLYVALVAIVFSFYFAYMQQEKSYESLNSYHNETTESFTPSDKLKTTFKIESNSYTHLPAGSLTTAEDVVIIIKTGATEIYRALPIQLITTLTHFPNHLLFSDHEQQIAQYRVQDALDEVSEAIMSANEDFELYLNQKKFIALGQSPEKLELKGGWALDRYKNIHMMKKTWQQMPNAKWYLFIDADTYVMPSNLLPYLGRLDHSKKLYMGDLYVINDMRFAQGGTGYVISHSAMQYVMRQDPDMPQKFEQMAKENCCGDLVIGAVMKTHGIPLSETYPNFCGEGPGRIGFLPKNHCQPVVTMHHMLPSEISDMWTFERSFARPNRFILFQDIFDHFVHPRLSDHRSEWDGLSLIHGAVVDLPSDLFESKEKELSKEEKREKLWNFCKQTCEEKKENECMQYQISKEECKIFNGVALGYKLPVTRDDREDFRSGWLVDRIEKAFKHITCEQPKMSWPKDVVLGA